MRLGPRATCFAALLIFITSSNSWGQLTILSPGDEAQKWRDAQLSTLRDQVNSSKVGGELRAELDAQIRWLERWQPGSLSTDPLWPSERRPVKDLEEPTIDPQGNAAKLREKLFGTDANPTSDDTEALRKLLDEYPNDVGVRQLHLQWLDQLEFRKTYPDEIASAALYLLGLMEQLKPQTRELQIAQAFCLYRRGRALAYRELPDVVAEKPILKPNAHQSELLGAHQQLTELVGKHHPNFILLDIRLLRRDKWYGRALQLLESHANSIDRRWFLKKRRDLLQELGWEPAYSDAAEIYEEQYPEQVAEETEAESN